MPLIVGTDPLAVEEFSLDLPTRTYLGDSDIVLANWDVADDFDCYWRRTGNAPWGNKPAPREQVGDRPYDHGQWDATKFYGPRTVTVEGHCRAPAHGDLHLAKQRLLDAVDIAGFTLRVTEPGYDSYVMARQQGELLWSEINRTIASFSFSLYVRDPLIYSSLERTFSIGFPVVSGGLVLPAVLPITLDTVGSSGSALLSNPSRLPVGLQLRVGGPVDTITIAFPSTGRAMNLDNPAGPVLGSGDFMTIDTMTRQVLLNGQASRRNWWSGDWLQLPPMAETTLAIAGTGTDSTSGVSGSYRATRI